MEQEDQATPIQATPIIGEIQVTGYRCRCGHEWASKNLLGGERPRVCPKCKSANWDRPYKFRRKAE